MNTDLSLSLAIFSLSFGFFSHGATHYTPMPEPTPTAIVEVVHDEIEIEYLPEVTVEIVHSEVEINGQTEG